MVMLLMTLFMLPGWMGAENPAGIFWSSFRVCNDQNFTLIFFLNRFIFLVCP